MPSIKSLKCLNYFLNPKLRHTFDILLTITSSAKFDLYFSHSRNTETRSVELKNAYDALQKEQNHLKKEEEYIKRYYIAASQF